MIHSFTFNGINTEEYGLYVGGQNTFKSPQRDVTKVSIPGKNGDLVRDNGRFLNTPIAYTIVAMKDFAETATAVQNWLMSVKGYARLEDTYHPDYFRIARVSDSITFETSAYNLTGKAQIVFDCQPQKFLKTGENAITMLKNDPVEGRTIVNPTLFDSKPLIRVYCTGSGTITVGNQIITISNVTGYVDIDCETQNCYNESVNCNNKVTLGTQGFPVLPSGDTTFEMTGDVTKIEVTGRWWSL